MKKVYIHVGIHKAGSTTIQRYFRENLETFSRYFYYYPESYHLGASLMNEKVAVSEVPWFRLKIGELFNMVEQDTIFLSSEGFFGHLSGGYSNNYKCARLLREMTADFDVHIIAIVREQSAFFESMYQQSIKADGKTHGFEEFFNALPWRQYDWNSLLKNGYEAVFGRDNMTVLPFESFKDPDDNPVAVILRMMGVAQGDIGSVPRYNASLSEEGLELMKEFNRTAGPDSVEERRLYRAQVEKSHPKTAKGLAHTPKKLQDEIRRTFQCSNVILAEKYGF